MKLPAFRFWRSVVWIAMLFVAEPVLLPAQKPGPKLDTILRQNKDFAQMSEATRELATRELKERQDRFIEHQTALKQSRLFAQIKSELENVQNYLRQGYAASEVYHEINSLTEWKQMAGDGVIIHRDRIPTVRNLTTSSILLQELLNRTNDRLKKILAYHKVLGALQYRLDSLMMDSVIYRVPGDSVAMARYFRKLILLGSDLEPVARPLLAALDSVQKTEIKVNQIRFSLESDISETEAQREALFDQIGLIESGSFGLGEGGVASLGETLRFSFGKAMLLLLFYIVTHVGALILMVVLVIATTVYMIMLRKKSRDEKYVQIPSGDLWFLNHPFAVSFLLVVTVFQIFLPLPPFVFSGFLWIITGIALSILLRTTVPGIWYRTWIIFFILSLFSLPGNLILRQTTVERWTIPLFSLAALSGGIYFLVNSKKNPGNVTFIRLFISMMILFELMALINFFTGGYNQSKTFMVSGYISILVAYLLYWTIRIFREILWISNFIHWGAEEDIQYSPRRESEIKVPVYLYVIFVIGWFVLVCRNFYFYQAMFGPIGEWLSATRTLGELSFTYKSIIVLLA